MSTSQLKGMERIELRELLVYKVYTLKPLLRSEVEQVEGYFNKIFHQFQFKGLSYLFQSEKFGLNRAFQESVQVVEKYSLLFQGKFNFGECILDEWFVTSMLFELSNQFEFLTFSVEDEDGQFLLIEAADYLPSWVEPSCMTNRVYVHKNQLRLVGLDTIPILANHTVNGLEALQVIEKGAGLSLDEKKINQKLGQKLEQTKQQVLEQFHIVECQLDRKVASLFVKYPQLIAKATEAYYLRDPLRFKVCQTMTQFPVSDPIHLHLQLTRTLFSQLEFQRLPEVIPKPFLPLQLDPAYQLGVKLSCGLEMYYSKLQRQSRNSQPIDDPNPTNWNVDPQWNLFFNDLVFKNYFEGEVEGSEKYQQKLKVAKLQFQLGTQAKGTLHDDLRRIEELRNQTSLSDQAIQQRNRTLPTSSIEWLDIDSEELDSYLNPFQGIGNFTNPTTSSEPNLEIPDIQDGLTKLGKLATDLTLFLDQEVGLEGVERTKDTLHGDCNSELPIQIDPVQFQTQLEQMLHRVSQLDTLETDDHAVPYQDIQQLIDSELDTYPHLNSTLKTQGMVDTWEQTGYKQNQENPINHFFK